MLSADGCMIYFSAWLSVTSPSFFLYATVVKQICINLVWCHTQGNWHSRRITDKLTEADFVIHFSACSLYKKNLGQELRLVIIEHIIWRDTFSGIAVKELLWALLMTLIQKPQTGGWHKIWVSLMGNKWSMLKDRKIILITSSSLCLAEHIFCIK